MKGLNFSSWFYELCEFSRNSEGNLLLNNETMHLFYGMLFPVKTNVTKEYCPNIKFDVDSIIDIIRKVKLRLLEKNLYLAKLHLIDRKRSERFGDL